MLALEFGVCREICIPAEAKFSLALHPAGMSGSPSPAVLAALERVPRRGASRRADDPQLKSATASLEGAAPRLTIAAHFPRDSQSADLFIEAPDGLYVPLPKRLPVPRPARRPMPTTGWSASRWIWRAGAMRGS